MIMQSNTILAFFTLVRAGLWEKGARLESYGKVDYEEIMRLAEEQSVVGIVTAGLEHVEDAKVPQEDLLKFIGQSLQIEQQNIQMNQFIGELVERMRKADIYTLMVKGQGVAQCYEKPLWRSSGDVDFYLSDTNFEKAKSFLHPLVESFDPDNPTAKHINMHYGPWVVELHGNQYFDLSQKVNRLLDEIHADIFYGGNVRSILLGGTSVFLPSPDNDVIIVFTHFLRHFFKGGIGLRQICDWCRLLWTYRERLNNKLLESRIKKAGLMTEWEVFAFYAVDYLGMPNEAMPLYDSSAKWKRKACHINQFILEVGNFGRNRDSSYYSKYPFLIRKMLSFGRRVVDVNRHMSIFPMDSFRFLLGMTKSGLCSVIHGE